MSASLSSVVVGAPGHPPAEDLVLYAMQLLNAEMAANMLVHLHDCDPCRVELARIYRDLALYASSVELESAPASGREHVIQQATREKKVVAAPRPQAQPQPQPQEPAPAKPIVVEFGRGSSPLFSSEVRPAKAPAHGRMYFFSGWAVAAALAAAVTFLLGDHIALREAIDTESGQLQRLNTDAKASRQLLDALTDPQAVRITLGARTQPRGPLGEVTYDADSGTLVFLASQLDPLLRFKTYQLWLFPNGGDPIPAGTFHPDDHGNGSIVLPDLPKGIPARSFAVTIEKEGGAQKPTPPLVLSGS